MFFPFAESCCRDSEVVVVVVVREGMKKNHRGARRLPYEYLSSVGHKSMVVSQLYGGGGAILLRQ